MPPLSFLSSLFLSSSLLLLSSSSLRSVLEVDVVNVADVDGDVNAVEEAVFILMAPVMLIYFSLIMHVF
jgi:hypothetical protein